MRCAALLTSSLLLLAACDADDRVTGPEGEETSANPRDVTISLDQSRTASALIPEEGGTISATAADGRRFTLTIPAGALFSEERITVTPVTAVNGLPLSGGLIGAVQLEPDGLRLMEFATLTIESSAGFSAEEATGIAWLGSGTDFHLYPVEVNGSTITLKVNHFSGYGAGKDANRQELKKRRPKSTEAATKQDLVPPQRLPPGDLLEFWYKHEIKPALNDAINNREKLDAAFEKFVSWYVWLEDYKVEGRFTTEIKEAISDLDRALRSALDSELILCTNDALPVGRVMLLLHFFNTLREIDGVVRSDAIEKAKRCLSFELTFRSVVRLHSNELEFTAGSALRTDQPVPLRLEFQDGRLDIVGQGTLGYPLFTIQDPRGCLHSGGTHPGELRARLVVGGIRSPKIMLFLKIESLERARETIIVQCDRAPLPFSGTGLWLIAFLNLHVMEMAPPSLRFSDDYFVSWAFENGKWTKQYASGRRAFALADLAEAIEDALTLEVIHTPQR